ncbi:hypothetical protein AB0F18_02320 [Streptomyces sp. NPDC029216]|uniref:hypothetical protein n=1 Tax=Streptomyces sp. NPDC029216 TaxID=3154701 RepID=UPI0034005451
MEEVAYVAAKIVKGLAGLAYMVGDGLLAMSGPDGPVQGSRKKKDEETDKER